jgi:hypothetical protein
MSMAILPRRYRHGDSDAAGGDSDRNFNNTFVAAAQRVAEDF